MKLYDKLPIIGLCALILMIVLAGPLVGVVRSLHADPNIVGVGIGAVAAILILLLIFRRHLAAAFNFARQRIEQLENAGMEDDPAFSPGWQEDRAHPALRQEYPALPAPGQAHRAASFDDDYAQDRRANARTSSRSMDAYNAQGEPVLMLAENCPLPFSSAFNHTLIYEAPGGGRDRSIAARLYIELFGTLGSIPQLIITKNSSYASVLGYLTNGWLAGNPEAREERAELLARYSRQAPELAQHYASIDKSNARSFARKAIAYGAQVVVDLSTYRADPAQTSPVLWRLLMGALESEQPCLITLLDADFWLPDEPVARRAYVNAPDDPQEQLRVQIQRVLSELMASHHVLYLVTSSPAMVDEHIVKQCVLWLLNCEPQNGRDAALLCYQTRLSREGLLCLRDHSILAEPRSGSAMELVLYHHQSAHEEPRHHRSTPRLLHDLSAIAADEEEEELGLGK